MLVLTWPLAAFAGFLAARLADGELNSTDVTLLGVSFAITAFVYFLLGFAGLDN